MPTAVIEAVNAILRQSGLGENFRADFEKQVKTAYDAGAATSCTHVHSVPLTDKELDLIRAALRAKVE